MTKDELEKRVADLEQQLQRKDGIQTFNSSGRIFESMIDAKLDPKEAYHFFTKYGEFLRFGVINKQVNVQGSLEYLEADKDKAFFAGVRCFEAFLDDFAREYEKKSIQNS